MFVRHVPMSILIVEDHADTATSMVQLMEHHGFFARVAGNGDEAIEAARDEPPDVILLDIGLPDADGWTVAGRLRDQARGKQPFIVALTGYESKADKMRSADVGIDLHLVKPLEPKALVSLLKWLWSVLASVERFSLACEERGKAMFDRN